MSKKDCKLILALDLPDADSAFAMLGRLKGNLSWVKIGLQMYVKYGADFVRKVADMGFKIFLDLKLYDIPNTVASAVESLKDLPISMLTVHAGGGSDMMKAAAEAAARTNPNLSILAVTVLTSFDDDSLKATGVALPAAEQVGLLARLAEKSGVGGLVCSPLEVESLRKIISPKMLLVTPGVRPSGSDKNEQKRVMTPASSARAGSDFIVVGRPILRAEDPSIAALSINSELKSALEE